MKIFKPVLIGTGFIFVVMRYQSWINTTKKIIESYQGNEPLAAFLKKYFAAEQVELIIIGMPLNWDETDTHGTPLVKAAIKKLQKEFPGMPLKTVDERYTSKMAKDAMLEMGMKKKDRRVKSNVDLIAATIILQEYLQSVQ